MYNKIFESKWERVVRYILIIFLFSFAFTIITRNDGDKIYEFSYNQMTERLENIKYNPKMDNYLMEETNVAFQFYISDKTAAWQYLYADYQSDENIQGKFKFLNSDKQIIAEQVIELQNGKNEIILKENKFEILRIELQAKCGTYFSIRNMCIREKRTERDYIDSFISIYCVCIIMFFFFSVLVRNKRIQKYKDLFDIQRMKFFEVFGECQISQISYKKKRIFRISIIICILSYIIYCEIQGKNNMASKASLNMWLLTGLIIIFSIFCWESVKKIKKDRLLSICMLFLVYSCISDFFLNKKFRYAAFAMIIAGGILNRCWCSMKQKEDIIEEFKLAFKIIFFGTLIFCVFCRPAQGGVCYSGYLPDSLIYGNNMLIALAIFLTDIQKENTGVLNGIGAMIAIYLIWLTQQPLVVFAAVIIIFVFIIFKLYSRKGIEKKSIKENKINLWIIGVAGICAVFLLRKILYDVTPDLNLNVIFENDQNKEIKATVLQSVKKFNWKYFWMTKWLICKEYIRNLNIIGHSYLAEFHSYSKWPEDQVIMNAFRYGVISGVLNIQMIIICLNRALNYTKKNKDFFVFGITLASILTGSLGSVEIPFSQMGWLIFYFAICCILVLDN